METEQVPQNTTMFFRFINPMEDGPIKVRFVSDDNRLEIDLPCKTPFTVNRLYIEKTEGGFSVYSHNHNSPDAPNEEREINCEF